MSNDINPEELNANDYEAMFVHTIFPNVMVKKIYLLSLLFLVLS